MSYTALAVVGVVVAAALDLLVLRTRLLTRKVFWVAYAIVLLFQLITNGVLTGFHIVRYDPGAITGHRIAYAPVEDLLFGFSLVLQTLAWWVFWGRRARTARTHAGAATAMRRGVPTDTR
ncbi:MAG TPA: lycopene cyclase domain-containing protein [Mycobacteriales bacterium]|nr:lycopene cyclase domain-containing protein [Mycobacteriales bacterium]